MLPSARRRHHRLPHWYALAGVLKGGDGGDDDDDDGADDAVAVVRMKLARLYAST